MKWEGWEGGMVQDLPMFSENTFFPLVSVSVDSVPYGNICSCFKGHNYDVQILKKEEEKDEEKTVELWPRLLNLTAPNLVRVTGVESSKSICPLNIFKITCPFARLFKANSHWTFSSYTFASLCNITRQSAKKVSMQWRYNLADSWGWGIVGRGELDRGGVVAGLAAQGNKPCFYSACHGCYSATASTL